MKLLLSIILLTILSKPIKCQQIVDTSGIGFIVKYLYYTGDTFALKYEVIEVNEYLETLWKEKYNELCTEKKKYKYPVKNLTNLAFYPKDEAHQIFTKFKSFNRLNFSNQSFLIPDSLTRKKCFDYMFLYDNCSTDFHEDGFFTVNSNYLKKGLYIGLWKIKYNGFVFKKAEPTQAYYETYFFELLHEEKDSISLIDYLYLENKKQRNKAIYIYKSEYIKLKKRRRKKRK